jgi:hypothetical protein
LNVASPHTLSKMETGILQINDDNTLGKASLPTWILKMKWSCTVLRPVYHSLDISKLLLRIFSPFFSCLVRNQKKYSWTCLRPQFFFKDLHCDVHKIIVRDTGALPGCLDLVEIVGISMWDHCFFFRQLKKMCFFLGWQDHFNDKNAEYNHSLKIHGFKINFCTTLNV